MLNIRASIPKPASKPPEHRAHLLEEREGIWICEACGLRSPSPLGIASPGLRFRVLIP
jgi:hypothetical protein